MNFVQTHLDIIYSDDIDKQPNENQYEHEKILIETANNLVEHILNEAISEIIEYEKNYLLNQVAVEIVADVMENIFNNYDSDFNVIESIPSSSSSSDNENDEADEYDDEYLSSSDDEENQRLIPQISDQPYLFVNDVITSRSTQELGNLIQELKNTGI